MRYVVPILDTPLPAGVLRGMMDAISIFLRTLQADHAGASDALASLAGGSLYVRAHWLRMPALLLARHLLTKACRREQLTAH